MKLPRRNFLRLAAGTAALPALPRAAFALDYPTRPVHVAVGFPAGLAPDIVTRLVGQKLSQRLGQPVVVDDKPGAGGNIAAEHVIRSSADGYTLLFATVTNTVNAALYRNLSFDFVRDIAPVASIGRTTFVMVVNPSVPAKTLAEFVAYAKANPGKINMCSPGIGTADHVFGALFEMMAGVDLVHVPYRGSFYPDLISGQVQVAFTAVGSALGYVRGGKLRALAVTTTTRSKALPSVPAMAETVPGYEASGWNGIVAPRNTPTGIVDKLNGEIGVVVADPVVTARLAALGIAPLSMTPAAFGKLIAAEAEKWAKVVKFAKITAQ